MGRYAKHYTTEFKERAVKLCLESDKGCLELANDLGVPVSTLSTWKSKYLKAINKTKAFSSSNDNQDELVALKAKLRDVEEERDILKKALAICNSIGLKNLN